MKTPRGDEFEARLVSADGKRLAPRAVGNGEEANRLKTLLDGATYVVDSIEAKPVKRTPSPPFTTSTLQQAASSKLGFSASRTMQVAQKLYEGVDIGGETVGLITYMRTDGVQMAPESIEAAREAIGSQFGNRYLPEKPRLYSTKAKNAQEAHEAIRPTDFNRTPDQVRRFLDGDMLKLYDLVWKRGIASQMASAEIERTTAEITADNSGNRAGLRATGSVIRFDGFIAAYTDAKEDGEQTDDGDEDGRLPEINATRRPGKAEDQCLAAFHRAAAALLGSNADQEDGRTRHRPAFHLCRDGNDPSRSRLHHQRQTQARAPGQGQLRHGVPGKLLHPLCRLRLHGVARRKARPGLGAARSTGKTFFATSGRTSSRRSKKPRNCA